MVYHGSPTGTFNVFRTDYGVYFTTNKEYAKRYTRDYERGDSAKIYECYINIEKPFDTREKKARDIFNKEFYMHYGTGTALQESGLPDWTDGDDLVDFLKEKGYD